MQKQARNNTDALFAQFATYEISTEQASLVRGGVDYHASCGSHTREAQAQVQDLCQETESNVHYVMSEYGVYLCFRNFSRDSREYADLVRMNGGNDPC